jgi:hypothetical protein
VFEVDEDLGRLNAMRFMPLETDNKLRCEGFPHYNPMGSIYYPTGTTEEMDIETLNQWLDSFIIQSKHVSTLYRTYVFVYFGDNLHKREYGTLFERLKNHAYLKRRISLEDFKIIKGGKRAKFGMEVFIIRRGAPPPVPSPTKP